MGKSKLKLLLIIFLAWIMVRPSTGLYLHMKHTDKKCFVEEIPDDTTVTGKYKVEMVTWNATIGDYSLLPPAKQIISKSFQGLTVQVQDPSSAIVLSKLYGLESRFTFTSHTSGEHIVCLIPNGTATASSLDYLRLHVDITIGGMAVDYEIIRKKEKLTEIQLRLRKLMDLADQVMKEQNYQRAREARFRETSESTNSRVIWFALLQTVMVIGIGYYQVQNLKEFFTQKKLV